MCGIVGAIAERNIVPILIEGALRRLEYRGYDSAGLAVLNGSKHLTRLRTVGKVKMLDLRRWNSQPTTRKIGICPCPLGDPGVPSERNAFTPTFPGTVWRSFTTESSKITMELRDELKRLDYTFTSGDRHRGRRSPYPPSPGHRKGSVQGSARHRGGARRRLRVGGRE